MHNVTVGDRLRYAFDNYMAKGTVALILGLAVISALIIFVAGLVISAAGIAQPGEEGYRLGEAMWLSLMRTLDAGTMGGDAGAGFRVAMLGVTLGGIFIVSALIGVLNNGLEDKLGELRRETLLTQLHQRIRDVRQGPDGLLYVVTDEDDGALLRIEPEQ